MSTVQQIIESQNQQILMWVIIAVIGLVSTIVLVVIMLVKNYLRTKEGKTIDRAKGKRAHLILAAGLSHFGRLMFAKDFIVEGILETAKFKDRKRKSRKLYQMPQQIEAGDIGDEVEKDMDPEVTRQFIQNMLNLTSEKLLLEGARVPISIAVEDKIIAAGIKGLGAMTFYNKLERIKNLKSKIELLQQKDSFKELGDAFADVVSKVSLVDFNLIRNYFDESWNQSTQESQEEVNYTRGFRDGRDKSKSGLDKMAVYLGIGLVIAGAAMMGVAIYLVKGA